MRYRLIDILRGTQVLSVYKAHLRFRGNAELLRSMQDQKLCELLIYLRQCHPYYRKSLLSVSPRQINKNPRAVVASLPIVDKNFVNQNHDLLLKTVSGRKYQAKRTGGSTGDPLYYYADMRAISQSWAYILWSWHKYAGYSPGDPYITVAGSSLGAFTRHLKNILYRMLQNNYLIPGDSISYNMEVSSRRIERSKHLFGYPSSICSLIEHHPDLFKKHQLKAVFTTSEQLMPKVRKFIEETLGVSVYDIYGANDGGVISCECDRHKGFHYDPLACYIEEYKNENGLTELLLTNLDAFSFPMVRYRVGDVAELGEFGSCRCGSPYPLIGNLFGRTRDLVRLKKGGNIHGSVFNKLVLNYPEIRRYRVIQSSDFKISFQVEIQDFDNWIRSTKRSDLEQRIEKMLPETGVAIERLSTSPNGNDKFKVIESHVH